MKWTILSLCLLISITSCAQPTGKFEKLDRYFSALEKHNRFMGNALILEGSKVIFHREIGFENQDKKVKLTPSSLFRIGSITKTYTATLILKLVEHKKIALDNKLSTYYPKVKNADKITIKQMLNHSSGLANYTNQADFGEYVTKAQSKKEMLARVEKLQSDFEPGSKHEYSNTNFLLLGYILEKISGRQYSEMLEKDILKPASLKNTYYQLGDQTLENEAKSYSRVGDSWEFMPHWNLDVAAAAGAMRSTANDLGMFVHNLFQGNILQASSMAEMTNFEDGYGFGLLEAPFYDKKLLTHGGKIEGFNSLYFHDKENDVTFIILNNGRNFEQNDITIAMASAYYGKEFTIPALAEKQAVEVAEDILKLYEGTYETNAMPLDIKIFTKAGELFGQATGQGPFPLKAISNTEFIFKSATIEIEFLKTNDGFTEMKFVQGGSKMIFKKK